MDAEIWEGFRTLNAGRQIGFEIERMPMTEIESYIRLFGVSEIELFVACIRSLDSIFVKHCRDKNAQNRKDK